MSSVGYINVSLEIGGGVISLVVGACLLAAGRSRSQRDRMFLLVLLCNAGALFSDAAAWLFKGHLDSLSWWGVRVSNFLGFTLNYFLLISFSLYLIAYLNEHTRVSRLLPRILRCVCLILVVLVVVSQFNGMFYYIDDYNIYHRGDWFWVTHVGGLFSMCVNAGLLVIYRRALEPRELISLFSYIVLPILGICIQIFVYGIALLNLLNTIGILLVFLFIQIEQTERMKERERELAQTRIDIMISQIQPHFLFNSLTCIRQLCDTEPQKASHALEHFSCFLRGNVESLSNKGLIPFEKEMVHVRDYLYLEKMRFGKKLNVCVETAATDFVLPPLSLQPIVENAVRHGIMKEKGCGTVTIKSERLPEGVAVTVTDDGGGFDTDEPWGTERDHVGIINVKKRLEIQCGGSLIIKGEKGLGTSVTILLP